MPIPDAPTQGNPQMAIPDARRPASPPPRPAFTLIELLVVIAIVAVLMGILLPSLATARQVARQTREVAAVNQLMLAYTLYADDFRGSLLPGYVPDAMVNPNPAPGQAALRVLDEIGDPVTGVPARRYPWRLAPYLDYNFSGLYFDPKLLGRYRARTDFQYVVSLSPSLGLNSTFLGGDSDRFGFNNAALSAWGPFYITRMDQALTPSRLLTFASARGQDPDGGSPVPGFFRVDAPYVRNRAWQNAYNESDPAGSYGSLHARYGGKVVSGYLDGHAEVVRPEKLDDMRIWANRATGPQWTVGTP